MYLAINPQAFGPEPRAGGNRRRIVASLHNCPAAAKKGKVRYPGEETLRIRAENIRLGLPVEPAVWAEIRAMWPQGHPLLPLKHREFVASARVPRSRFWDLGQHKPQPYLSQSSKTASAPEPALSLSKGLDFQTWDSTNPNTNRLC